MSEYTMRQNKLCSRTGLFGRIHDAVERSPAIPVCVLVSAVCIQTRKK